MLNNGASPLFNGLVRRPNAFNVSGASGQACRTCLPHLRLHPAAQLAASGSLSAGGACQRSSPRRRSSHLGPGAALRPHGPSVRDSPVREDSRNNAKSSPTERQKRVPQVPAWHGQAQSLWRFPSGSNPPPAVSGVCATNGIFRRQGKNNRFRFLGRGVCQPV